MEFVGADPAGRVEHAAAGAAHLRVIRVDLNLDVRERLDRRVHDRAPGQLGDRDAVEQVVVGPDAAAAQRDAGGVRLVLLAVELRVANRGDRRNRDRNQEGVAARGRQRLENLAVERVTDRGVGRLDERRVGRDGDFLFHRADFQHQVDGQELLGADRESAPLEGLVARERCADRVGGRRHGGERILADLVGDGVAGDGRALVGQGHGHAGDDPLRVADGAAHTAGELLAHRVGRPAK